MDYRATCCVLGAILINLTLGTFYSIGNIVPYLASYMRENGNTDVTSEHGTWITATFLLGQGLSIIGGSYIEQCFNSRIACIIGCLVHSASTYLTMWAINVNISTVILIYGFGSGLGCGSAYMASIIAAQKWFPNRKGFFTGLIVAGFGFGGLIFTNLQTIYLNPDNRPANQATGYFDQEVYSRVPHLFLYQGIIFTIVQAIGCIMAFPANSSTSSATHTQAPSGSSGNPSGNHHNTGQLTIIYGDEPLPNMTSITSAFNYKIFYVIGLMMMLVAPGVTFVNSLGKRYGQMFISDDRYLATVVAVAAVANAGGRLFWGFLADKFTFSTCFLAKVALFATLIAIFPSEFVLASRACYLIWMLGMFFGFSGTFVLFPVFIEQVFSSRYHGIIYGILYLFLAASSIMTSFVIQVTIGPALADRNVSSEDKLKTRIIPCVSIAAVYILSYVIFLLALPIRRLEVAIRRRKESELSRTRTSLANRPDLLVQDRGIQNLEMNAANSELGRENSLGSIVKFADNPVETEVFRPKALIKGFSQR